MQTLRSKFFGRVDESGYLAPDFLAGLDLAHDLVRPFVGHMAVGAARPHAGAIAVMNALHVRGIHVVFHFVATDAELLSIGDGHRPVESAHVCNARHEKEHGNDPHGDRASGSEHAPESRNREH